MESKINPQNNFWENYAKRYNEITPNFQKHLLKYVSQYSNGIVGDFGCGVGKLFSYYQKNPNISQLIAIDSSTEMLEYAKQKAKKLPFPSSIINQELNYENILNLNTKFNTINILNVLYSTQNPIEILDAISNKIVKNGTLCICDMSRNPKSEILIQRIKKEFQKNEHLEQFLLDNQNLMSKLNPKTYTINEIEYITKKLGFQTIQKSSKFYNSSANVLILNKK